MSTIPRNSRVEPGGTRNSCATPSDVRPSPMKNTWPSAGSRTVSSWRSVKSIDGGGLPPGVPGPMNTPARYQNRVASINPDSPLDDSTVHGGGPPQSNDVPTAGRSPSAESIGPVFDQLPLTCGNETVVLPSGTTISAGSVPIVGGPACPAAHGFAVASTRNVKSDRARDPAATVRTRTPAARAARARRG